MADRAFTILIADRNPRVRRFLKRELGAAGYRVIPAQNSRELMYWAFNSETIDLIIIDPDFPGDTDDTVVERLLDRIPAVPIVIHSSFANEAFEALGDESITVVEKGGGSIDRLKEIADSTRIRIGLPG